MKTNFKMDIYLAFFHFGSCSTFHLEVSRRSNATAATTSCWKTKLGQCFSIHLNREETFSQRIPLAELLGSFVSYGISSYPK